VGTQDTPSGVCSPMDALLAPYLDHLTSHGVRFSIADPLGRDPDHDGDPHADRRAVRPLDVDGVGTLSESRDPASAVGSDHATASVIAALVRSALVRPGSTFVDIGCGTGMIALAGARLGAARIIGTDIDAAALELARRNAQQAGVAIELYEGALLEPLPEGAGTGLVVANLPHKPRREAGDLPLSQDGGADGTALFAPFFDQLAARGAPGDRAIFFQHSLAHPRVLADLAGRYELTLLSWKLRVLGHDEYGPLQEWFVERSTAGTSFVGNANGRRHLIAGVWMAELR
jgi:SAM-dependent methyltransferase